jgi:tetratricopeptide (TPR) repeat protein
MRKISPIVLATVAVCALLVSSFVGWFSWQARVADSCSTKPDVAVANRISACKTVAERFPWRRIRALSTLSYIYLNMKDYEASIAATDQAIAIDPQNRNHYVRRALAHEGKGEWKRAIGDLDRAIELGDQIASTYGIRARMHLRLGNVEAVKRDLQTAAQIEPRYQVYTQNVIEDMR